MAETAASPFKQYMRGIGLRQVRLATGLVLFAYLVSHFTNHALGNISLSAMDDALYYHAMFWQSWPVAIVFYGATLTHMSLGVWALYASRQFRWTAIEVTQLVFGLSIPMLVVSHVVGVRLAGVMFAHEKDYPQTFFAYWVSWLPGMWMMYAALIVSWVHGCIGIYF
ncbi:MAG TPA: adenylate/guanylate cyclase domain-containing protein, partial [Afipia sp.]